MKKILLSSAAIVAFAGAAAAEVTFSGSAQLGYNDTEVDGFYADADLDITMTQELNNGWTASVTYGVELEDLNAGSDAGFNADNNLVLSLTNESYGIYYGNTATAAESLWSGAGDMAEDAFSEQDAEEVLKATANVGGIELAVSSIIERTTNDSAQASLGAKGTFGNFTVGLAYQEEGTATTYAAADQEDYTTDEILGLFASTSFGGADVAVAYASNETSGENSLGLEVSYPVGDVTLGAFYVSESASDDSYGVSADYAAGAFAVSAFYEDVTGTEDYGIEGSYDVGNGLVVYAGYIDSTEGYIGAEYDLGGGATIIASYADVDEEGEKEYNEGTSLILNLKF